MASAKKQMRKHDKFRVVQDSFGKIKIAKDVLYGVQTQRAIDNFNFSKRPMPRIFIHALALIKKASAQSNAQLNCIEPDHGYYIAAAADKVVSELLTEDYSYHFPVNVFQTGSATSTNMNMNEVLASIANKLAKKDKVNIKVHPNDQVNYGQSSNDVIPASIQLASSLAVKHELLPALVLLENKLIELAQAYQQVIKTGRTHLMDAMPLSLGDELTTWAFQVNEAHRQIAAMLPSLAELPLGGTAIGTGINADKAFASTVTEHLALLTSLPIQPCHNLAARISSQDVTLALHGQLKVLATVFIKLNNDLRWMNSGPNCGLNELRLKALQPGSSIMPGKVNPVISEAIIMMCTEVIGNDTTITLANQSGNFQLNVMLPLVADKVLGSIHLLTESANVFAEKALAEITVNQKQLAMQAEANPILATALNPLIGYDNAAKIAKKAMKEGRSVFDVACEMTDIEPAKLKQLLAPIKQAKPNG